MQLESNLRVLVKVHPLGMTRGASGPRAPPRNDTTGCNFHVVALFNDILPHPQPANTSPSKQHGFLHNQNSDIDKGSAGFKTSSRTPVRGVVTPVLATWTGRNTTTTLVLHNRFDGTRLERRHVAWTLLNERPLYSLPIPCFISKQLHTHYLLLLPKLSPLYSHVNPTRYAHPCVTPSPIKL